MDNIMQNPTPPKQSRLPTVLIGIGLLGLFLTTLQIWLVMSQQSLVDFFVENNVSAPEYSYLGLLIPILSIVDIFAGLYLRKQQNISDSTFNKQQMLARMLIILSLIVGPLFVKAFVLSAMAPFYELGNPSTQITPPKLTPTPNVAVYTEATESANWKTFTNTKYEYSVEYPANWDIEEAIAIAGVPNKPTWSGSILQKNELQKVSFLEKDEQAIWQGTIELNVLQNPKNLNLEEWAKQYFRPLGADPSVNLAKIVGDTTLGGKPAKKFDVFSFDHNEVVIATIHNNLVYQVTFAGENPNDLDIEIHQKIYDQILSTFRFLNVTPSPTTINPNQIVCTQDAKQCPDGSYVGRTGPNCEFAPCP